MAPTGPISKYHRTGATVSHAFMGDLRDTLKGVTAKALTAHMENCGLQL